MSIESGEKATEKHNHHTNLRFGTRVAIFFLGGVGLPLLTACGVAARPGGALDATSSAAPATETATPTTSGYIDIIINPNLGSTPTADLMQRLHKLIDERSSAQGETKPAGAFLFGQTLYDQIIAEYPFSDRLTTGIPVTDAMRTDIKDLLNVNSNPTFLNEVYGQLPLERWNWGAKRRTQDNKIRVFTNSAVNNAIIDVELTYEADGTFRSLDVAINKLAQISGPPDGFYTQAEQPDFARTLLNLPPGLTFRPVKPTYKDARYGTTAGMLGEEETEDRITRVVISDFGRAYFYTARK